MLIDIALLLAGLAFILVGANFMTDGSVAIAKRFGMSDFMVGMTIVAMMTSAPELVVSITGAFNASSSMAVGNIVGSNIFNILAIIGTVAVIKPIAVTRGLLVNEIPLVVLSSVALLVMGLSPQLDGGSMAVTRVDGLLLLLFFIVFLRYTFASTSKEKSKKEQPKVEIKQKSLLIAIVMTFGGLLGLILGGDWFVNAASSIASALGWSDALIGLTILAAGTSLPELATSIVSAVKGYPGVCLGNVIGSNIFNIFFVMGTTATITPLAFGGVGVVDLLTLVGASVLFWLFGRAYKVRTITRVEGVILLLCYFAYMVYLYRAI